MDGKAILGTTKRDGMSQKPYHVVYNPRHFKMNDCQRTQKYLLLKMEHTLSLKILLNAKSGEDGRGGLIFETSMAHRKKCTRQK